MGNQRNAGVASNINWQISVVLQGACCLFILAFNPVEDVLQRLAGRAKQAPQLDGFVQHEKLVLDDQVKLV